MTTYTSKVEINGEPTTDITYRISNIYQPNILDALHGTLQFDHDIKTSLLATGRQLLDLFSVYLIYDFEKTEIWPADSSQVEVLEVTPNTINFTLPLLLN